MAKRKSQWGVSPKKIKEPTWKDPNEGYEELYNELMSCGVSEEKAQEEVNKLKKSEENWKEIEEVEPTRDKNGHISLRQQVSVADLKAICDWGNLSEKEKEDALWQLGFNTKKYHYYSEVRMHVRQDGSRQCGEVVYGQERMDKEWLNKRDNSGRRVASEEARDRVRNYGLQRQVSLWDTSIKAAREFDKSKGRV